MWDLNGIHSCHTWGKPFLFFLHVISNYLKSPCYLLLSLPALCESPNSTLGVEKEQNLDSIPVLLPLSIRPQNGPGTAGNPPKMVKLRLCGAVAVVG